MKKTNKANNIDFRNVGVFVTEDFSKIYAVKAAIGEPSTVKAYGVVPSKTESGAFNCKIGDYQESRCSVTLDFSGLDDEDRDEAEFGLGIRGMWWSSANICEKPVRTDSIGALLEKTYDGETVGHYGFFKTADDAVSAVSAKASEYRKSLEKKISEIKPADAIAVIVHAVQ